MKKIWQYLTHHLQQDFHRLQYAAVFVFLAIAVYLNYSLDFEDNILDAQSDLLKPICYFLFFATAYYTTLLTYSLGNRQYDFWKSREFWVRSLLVLIVLGIDSSAPFLRTILRNLFDREVQFWAYKVSVNMMSYLTVMLPLLLFYFIHDRNERHVYGLRAHQFDTRPYIVMLAIMLPLIIAASFHESFLNQYPMYRTSKAHEYLQVPEWITAVTYELAYGLDFVTVEFLFRGFMVIGMMHILGRKAVLAMAVTYCFLHFGKPPGEAISSIFGGYILGIIAYETKSIWGGIIVHVGIAWMMECVAYLMK